MKTLAERRLVAVDPSGGFLLREDSRALLTPHSDGMQLRALRGISAVEPIEAPRRSSSVDANDPGTRSLGRLREAVSVLRGSESQLRGVVRAGR